MTKGVKGLTTAEVASLLKAVGCTEALNLDGGGSSCMIVKGQQTIKPSDGHERKVLDACYIQ
jgi:exopolysaccharide biosynthesis protein